MDIVEILHRFTLAVLFSYDVDDNTIKITVEAAVLSGADLRGADLRGADLRGADLRGANLRGADLRCAIGDMKTIKSLQIDKYMISYTKTIISIGCKQFAITEWEAFTDDEISAMDNGALEWWRKWKEFIFTAIKLSFDE